MQFQRTLEKICDDVRLENEFLNLLSLLEYVGCRKILKGVPFESVDCDVLQHVQEESLHALMLRRLVPPGLTWGAGLFIDLGWKYFRELDLRISARVAPSYVPVSFAIESRVLEVYPLFIQTTRRGDVGKTLEAILLQERRHAARFESTVDTALASSSAPSGLASGTQGRAAREAGGIEEPHAEWLQIESVLWREFENELDARVHGFSSRREKPIDAVAKTGGVDDAFNPDAEFRPEPGN